MVVMDAADAAGAQQAPVCPFAAAVVSHMSQNTSQQGASPVAQQPQHGMGHGAGVPPGECPHVHGTHVQHPGADQGQAHQAESAGQVLMFLPYPRVTDLTELQVGVGSRSRS